MKKYLFLILLTMAFFSIVLFAEAEKTDEKPEKNNATHLQWSNISKEKLDWKGALNYCKNVSDGDFKDWRLPNIDELRESIVNCSKTEFGGECKVSEKIGCLSSDCKNPKGSCNCERMKNNGFYSVFGDPDYVGLWSSSALSNDSNSVWGAVYYSGMIGNLGKSGKLYARCVRTAEKADNRVYLGGGKAVVMMPDEVALVEDGISRNFSKIRKCYEMELEKNPNLAGRINIEFVVSKTGSVIGSAMIGKSTLNSTNVAKCIAAEVEKIKFPPTKRGKAFPFVKTFVFEKKKE